MSGKSEPSRLIRVIGRAVLTASLILLPAQAGRVRAHPDPSLTSQGAASRPGQGETVKRALEPGRPVEREMEGGAVHAYAITIAKGQYLHVAAEQLGIDVVLALVGPDGKQLGEIDRWSRRRGLESISLIAAESGEHRLLVRSSDKDAPVGKYRVWVEERREPKPQDTTRIEAERAYDSGDKLNALGTPESQRGAIEKLEVASGLWKALGDNSFEATTLLYLGLIHYELGDTQEALDYNKQSLPLWRAVGDRDGEVFALSNIGRAYDSFGEYQQALDNYEPALSLARAVGDRDWEAELLHNFGMVYTSLGDYPQAVKYYQEGLKLNEVLKARGREAHLLHHIGEVHILAKEVEKARGVLERALPLSREVGDTLGEATTLNHLGRVADASGKKQEALDYFNEALRLRQKKGYPLGEAQTLHNIGVVYASLGEHQKALAYNQQSLQISQKVGDRRGEAYTLYSIAKTYRDGGDLARARSNIEAAIEIIEKLRGRIASHELRSSYFATTHDFYELYIDLLMRLHKQYPSAGYDAAALWVSERARARSLLDLLSESRIDIRQGVDPELLERERSLRHGLDAKADYQVRLLGSGHSDEQAAAVSEEINALAAEYRQVQTQIRQRNPRYAALTQPQPLTSEETRRQVLDSDTLLLEYFLGEEHSYLWLVSSTGLTSYELPGRSEIEKLARSVYDLLTARGLIIKGETDKGRIARIAQAEAEYPAAATALSSMVLGPAARQLANRRLLVIGDGTLQYVPFASLPDPSAKTAEPGAVKSMDASHAVESRRAEALTPLVLKHEIVSLPSASTLVVLRGETSGRREAAKTLAVFADPVFDRHDERVRAGGAASPTDDARESRRARHASPQGVPRAEEESEGDVDGQRLERLFGSRWEAEAITSQVPAGMTLKALDFAVSRETVSSPVLSQYRIVHFATHAFVDNEHPELSGIVLSLVDERGAPQDGYLRVHDIFNLRLPAELIVLSACRTGLGKEIKGEGLVGLTRAFMYAGAPRVVASLWSVNDKATAELMRRFYRKMLGPERQTAAAALRAAQIEMWQDMRWQSPYLWAGFVLQGEWR